jgi:enoyl-CoA hydratase
MKMREARVVNDTVVVETEGRVMVITINRPEARNAIDGSVAAGIAAAIDDMESRDDVSVAVLTGAGGTFCAGMDLKSFVRGESPSIPGRGFAGLTESPPTKPLIAAVEGWALAGGCELALSADIVVAGASAKFGLPEVKRGLVAAGGGLLRLPKAMPYSVAMLTALTGEPMTAVDAERHGLVTVLAADGQALSASRAIAAKIAANGPLAVRATKQIIAQRSKWTEPDAFDWQRTITVPVRESADAKEGALAFVEKRAPHWRGE